MITKLYFLSFSFIIITVASSVLASESSNDDSKYFKKLDSMRNNMHQFSYSQNDSNSLLKLQKRLNVRLKKDKVKKKQLNENSNIGKDLFIKALNKYQKNLEEMANN